MGEIMGPGACRAAQGAHGEGQGAHTSPWPTPISSPSPFVTEQDKHRAGLRDKPTLLRHEKAGEGCKLEKRARTHAATAFPWAPPSTALPQLPLRAPCPGRRWQSARLSLALPREGTGLGVTEHSEGHPLTTQHPNAKLDRAQQPLCSSYLGRRSRAAGVPWQGCSVSRCPREPGGDAGRRQGFARAAMAGLRSRWPQGPLGPSRKERSGWMGSC